MLRGNWLAVVDGHNRFEAPREFVKVLKAGGPTVFPLVIVAGQERLHFVPHADLERVEEDLKSISERAGWIGNAQERLRKLHLHPMRRLYEGDKVASRLVDRFLARTSSEQLPAIALVRGKEFDKLAGDIFAKSGIRVLGSVCLSGGGMNLVLLESGRATCRADAILECNHFTRRKRQLSLAQVVRLYAPDDSLRRRGALLVSTINSARPANASMKQYEIEFREFRKLLGWLKETRLICSERYPPVLGVVQPDGHGRIGLEEGLLSYIFLGKDREVTIQGQLDNFEVWSTKCFLAMISRIPLTPEKESVLRKFGV